MKSAGSCDSDSQTPEKMAQDLGEYLELDRIGQALNLAQPWLLGSKSPSAFKALGEIHAARRALERLWPGNWRRPAWPEWMERRKNRDKLLYLG